MSRPTLPPPPPNYSPDAIAAQTAAFLAAGGKVQQVPAGAQMIQGSQPLRDQSNNDAERKRQKKAVRGPDILYGKKG